MNKDEVLMRSRPEGVTDPAGFFSRETPESYFPGGDEAWLKYRNSNLKYPERAINNLVKGTVEIKFQVGPTGKIRDIVVDKSVEMSLDDEGGRVIEILRTGYLLSMGPRR
ncbi:MAG: TonB family protein [Bacteroidetes bacterium]|nr:TonB family protein [Bacteroidota bacterium]